MPSWKKVIISGSNAALNSLTVSNGITGSLFGTASFATTAATSSFLNSTTNAFIQNGNSFGTTALLGTNDNQSLALETSGSTRMFISSSGNVGIGTTSPSEMLEVQNGPSGAKIKVSNSAGGYASLECSSNASSVAQLNFTNQLSLIGGNVGIGTASPSAKLDVAGTGKFVDQVKIFDSGYPSTYATSLRTATGAVGVLQLGNNNDNYILAGNTGANGYLIFRVNCSSESVTSGIEAMRITAAGNVGIGTESPSYPLHVSASVSGTSIYATGDIVAFSDQSVKENIRPIENVLERIGDSRGVLYDRIDNGEKDNIGFIAQELEVAFPELVVTNSDGTKAVKYQNAVAVLFEAIKEQQKQINSILKLLDK